MPSDIPSKRGAAPCPEAEARRSKARSSQLMSDRCANLDSQTGSASPTSPAPHVDPQPGDVNVARLGQHNKNSKCDSNISNNSDAAASQGDPQGSKRELTLMRSRFNAANAELNRIKGAESEKVKVLEKRIAELEHQAEDAQNLDHLIAALTKQIRTGEITKREILNLQNAHFELFQEARRLKSDTLYRSQENDLAKIQTLERERTKLNNQLVSKQEENNELHLRLKEASAKNTELVSKLSECQLIFDDVSAQLKVVAAKDEYIGELEAANKTINKKYTDAVQALRSNNKNLAQRKLELEGWKDAADKLEKKVQVLESSRSGHDAKEPTPAAATQNDKHGFWIEIDETSAPSRPVSPPFLAAESSPKTGSRRVSPFSLAADLRLEADTEAGTAIFEEDKAKYANMESTTVPTPNTAKNFDLPRITVHIDPTDRLNWSWVQKMRATVKRQQVHIEGPYDKVLELNNLMNVHVFEDEARIKKVESCEKTIEKLKKDLAKYKAMPTCMNNRHKRLVDDLNARIEQENLNHMLLRDQGRQMKELRDKNEQSQKAIATLRTKLAEQGGSQG